MKNRSTSNDSAAILRMLNRSQAAPSAAHDEAVLAAADRLLEQPGRSSESRWQIPAALAATVLLALSIALQGVLRVEPAAPDPAVRAGVAMSEPETGARLDALPSRLSWAPVGAATGYRVVLRDAAADIVWTSALLNEPQLPLDGDAAAHLAGLETCIWSVEVIGSATTFEVGPFWFHLRIR